MPTLTGYTDMAPCPRVDVLIDAAEVDPSAVTLTIFQSSAEGEFAVRDGSDLTAAGGAFVTDYEAPLGVEVTYFARQYSADGDLIGLTASASTTLVYSSGVAVISDPLAPLGAVQVTCERSFGSSLVPAREISTYRVGRNTVALMGEQGGFRGIPMPVVTFTSESADALEDLIAEGRLLVRTAPPMRLPRLLNIAVSSCAQEPLDFHVGGETVRWPLVGEQIARSELAVLEPVVTWQEYIDAFVTWQDMIDVYPTWLDAISNPPTGA